MKIRAIVLACSGVLAVIALAVTGCGGGGGGSSGNGKLSASQAAGAALIAPLYVSNNANQLSTLGDQFTKLSTLGSVPATPLTVSRSTDPRTARFQEGTARISALINSSFRATLASARQSGTRTVAPGPLGSLTCANGGSGTLTGTADPTTGAGDIVITADHCLNGSLESNGSAHVVVTVDAATNTTITTITTGNGDHVASPADDWTYTVYSVDANNNVTTVPSLKETVDLNVLNRAGPDAPLAGVAPGGAMALDGIVEMDFYDGSGANSMNITYEGTRFNWATDNTAQGTVATATTTTSGGLKLTAYDPVGKSSLVYGVTYTNYVDTRSWDTAGDPNQITWTLNGTLTMDLGPTGCGKGAAGGDVTIVTDVPVAYNASTNPFTYTAGEMTINGATVVFNGGVTVDGTTYPSLGQMAVAECGLTLP